MATLAGVLGMVHTPFCYVSHSYWPVIRARRALRADVPEDGDEIEAKAQRVQQSFALMRQKADECNADVVIIFGDDQLEYLDFNSFPPFAIFAGEEFTGSLSYDDMVRYRLAPEGAEAPKQTLKGHPELAGAMLSKLYARGFDPAFGLTTDSPRHVGHAFMRPAESATDCSIPIIPVMVNCYYAPQATATRCYELGKVVREAIDAYPTDLRVLVIGSGGLWHTPGAKGSYLDEDFDRQLLGFLEKGEIASAAQFFDSYQIPDGDESQPLGQRTATSTGLPESPGPQGGTREYCNWIAAAAVADGSPWTVVDYVPIYSSPVGAGFAYCNL